MYIIAKPLTKGKPSCIQW